MKRSGVQSSSASGPPDTLRLRWVRHGARPHHSHLVPVWSRAPSWRWSAASSLRRSAAGAQIFRPFLALLLLCAMPHSAHAQVFIASHPQPEFAIDHCSCQRPWKENTGGPLAADRNGVVSLALPRSFAPRTFAQDLYLLWPAEWAEQSGRRGRSHPRPPGEPLGFRIKEHGRLRPLGTQSSGDGHRRGVRQLARRLRDVWPDSGLAAGARGATFIRIPWSGVGRAWTGSSGSNSSERRGRHEARELAGGDVLGRRYVITLTLAMSVRVSSIPCTSARGPGGALAP